MQTIRKMFCLIFFILCPTGIVHANQEVIMQKFNQGLHDMLPENILERGELIVVDDGTVPPFYIYDDQNSVEGASIELLTAISEILGIKIKYERVNSLPAILVGIKSGRYDMSMSPVSDTLERQKEYDFVDYIQEYLALIVKKDNPKQIHSYGDLCGKQLTLQTGGSSEKKALKQSEICVQSNKPEIIISSYKDVATSTLAVKSDRTDAYQCMAAIGSYYVGQSNGELELVNVALQKDFPFENPVNRMGAVVTKDSPLGPVLLAAIQELFDNGTYQAIMKKWSVENNMIEAPGINLVK